MSLELTVQIAIRSRLVTTPQVTALVPIGNIVDRSARPVINPSIVIGEQQSVDDGETINRDRTRVYSTLHVWRKEQSLADVKGITWAVRKAIARGRLELGSSFHCVDCFVANHRYERDPDGETAHGIITIETLVEEIA